MRILTLLFFSFILSSFFSQSKIIGKVIDEEFNETMPFANVLVKGTNNGVTTDFDGNYSVNIKAGTYTLIFSFVGYKTKELTDIIVKENDVKEINVNLSSASVGLEEVVVSVSVQKNTEEALLMMQKKSANLMDGLSSEAFKKVGSSNLANAIKRAPGVSIMGGKYVYVRGLGDRYTKSILNGIDIPGLDP
ncbi:MAG: carboxypeptidase-like regulatory domain-containing protein, partial [Flavobacteriales bacterium]|nr:carboxypeptidase-like regulatory domain-containing protein [Flavobacteriales bacterium]